MISLNFWLQTKMYILEYSTFNFIETARFQSISTWPKLIMIFLTMMYARLFYVVSKSLTVTPFQLLIIVIYCGLSWLDRMPVTTILPYHVAGERIQARKNGAVMIQFWLIRKDHMSNEAAQLQSTIDPGQRWKNGTHRIVIRDSHFTNFYRLLKLNSPGRLGPQTGTFPTFCKNFLEIIGFERL